MNFNFDTGTIDGGLQTLDVSTLPPLGGQAGVLTIIGTGAVELPKGAVLDRPATPAAGMFRYNTDSTALEFHNGTSWVQLAVGGGTVTSVAASSNSAALVVSGSPVTTSGTLAFSLDADLTALAELSSTGFAVRSAADTWVQRSIVGTAGNISVADGTGVGGNPTINLATITQAATGDFVKVTLDTFGRVTGNTAVVQSDITTLVDSVYVNVAGDTMTGDLAMGNNKITGLGAPTAPSDATNKEYVDNIAQGIVSKPAARVGTLGDLTNAGNVPATVTYLNGTAGVGATLTIQATSSPGADPITVTIDGYALSATDVTNSTGILVKNQTNAAENGRYYVSSVDANTVVLTRCALCDVADEIPGSYVFIQDGTQEGTGWVAVVTNPDTFVVGTDDIDWYQFSGAGTYTAGTGLTLTGTQFSLTTPVSAANGGTGINTSTATNGQLLIGNGSGLSLSTLTAGTGIGIVNGAGSITINNSGVTSLTGTANEIEVSAATGAVTVGLPSDVTIAGSLTVTGLTANGALYATTAGLVGSTAALTDGQILIGDTGSAPVAGTITGGTGVTVTNGAGTISISVDNTEIVTSFSAGTTGLTPSVVSYGDIVLGGTLAVTNGGTGLTALGTANQILGVDAAGTSAEYKSIAAGTGVSVVHGANVVTISNTGVTSVGLALPSIFTVSGSPVTTTGTLTGILATQAANTVFAGPATGVDAAPTFRALTLTDLGTAIQLYKENPSTPIAPSATGTNAVAIGSGSAASAANGFAVGDGSSARLAGQKAYANGSFASAGDAQHGVYVLRNTTTDSTYTEVFLDGAAAQLVIADNSVYVFDILVAGRRTDAVGGGAGYRFVGVARKDATSGSMTFVGTPSKTVIGETNNAWDARVTSDTTNGAIKVEVRGETAKTINWVATVMTTEVTN